jgi:DNA-binding protein YbaB
MNIREELEGLTNVYDGVVKERDNLKVILSSLDSHSLALESVRAVLDGAVNLLDIEIDKEENHKKDWEHLNRIFAKALVVQDELRAVAMSLGKVDEDTCSALESAAAILETSIRGIGNVLFGKVLYPGHKR